MVIMEHLWFTGTTRSNFKAKYTSIRDLIWILIIPVVSAITIDPRYEKKKKVYRGIQLMSGHVSIGTLPCDKTHKMQLFKVIIYHGSVRQIDTAE